LVGPIVGGTYVTLTGTGFYSSALLNCKFTGASSIPTNDDVSCIGSRPDGSLSDAGECPGCGIAVFVSPTRVLCKVPSGSLLMNPMFVSLSNDGRTWTNQGASFEYYPNPSVTSIYPNSGLIVGGSYVTITGSNFQRPNDANTAGVDGIVNPVKIIVRFSNLARPQDVYVDSPQVVWVDSRTLLVRTPRFGIPATARV